MAGIYNIVMEQGATLAVTMTWKDSNGDAVDLTNYSARLQVRKTVEATTTEISLTDSAGITLGGVAGTIALAMTATETAALDFTKGVYDLELEDASGVVTRLLEGTWTVRKEVTRA